MHWLLPKYIFGLDVFLLLTANTTPIEFDWKSDITCIRISVRTNLIWAKTEFHKIVAECNWFAVWWPNQTEILITYCIFCRGSVERLSDRINEYSTTKGKLKLTQIQMTNWPSKVNSFIAIFDLADIIILIFSMCILNNCPKPNMKISIFDQLPCSNDQRLNK